MAFRTQTFIGTVDEATEEFERWLNAHAHQIARTAEGHFLVEKTLSFVPPNTTGCMMVILAVAQVPEDTEWSRNV